MNSQTPKKSAKKKWLKRGAVAGAIILAFLIGYLFSPVVTKTVYVENKIYVENRVYVPVENRIYENVYVPVDHYIYENVYIHDNLYENVYVPVYTYSFENEVIGSVGLGFSSGENWASVTFNKAGDWDRCIVAWIASDNYGVVFTYTHDQPFEDVGTPGEPMLIHYVMRHFASGHFTECSTMRFYAGFYCVADKDVFLDMRELTVHDEGCRETSQQIMRVQNPNVGDAYGSFPVEFLNWLLGA